MGAHERGKVGGVTRLDQTDGARTMSALHGAPGFSGVKPVRELLGATGEFSTDAKQGPILAQSWYVLESIRRTVESAGGQMSDVIKLVQYFRNLDHFPYYSRVRKLFYPDQPPVSTVVQVSEMLPDATVLIEVEATVWLPPSFNSEAPR